MRELIERFDHTVLAWLNRNATPWLDQRAVEVTALGDGYTTTVLVVAIGAVLWLFGARLYAAALAASSLGAALLTPVLKNTFERPRPDLFEVRNYFEETSWAYPSGHAMLSSATLFTVAWIVSRIAQRRAVSVAALSIAATVVLLTGWSRLHLNVHHPSDVIAGHAIGLSWALLCVALAERLRARVGETIHWRGRTIQPPAFIERNHMTRPALVLSAVLAVIAACGVGLPAAAQQLPAAAAPVRAPEGCAVVRAATPLPAEVRETSGLARGAHGFWTHNDAGNDPVVFRLDDAGRIAQRVTVAGASLVDWEDIEAAPCDDATCLYIGDIGDNDAERTSITVYRVREPHADLTTATAEQLRLVYPDGARDAESLFVGVDGTTYVVTKGRREQIALYRVGPDAWQSGNATLERVRVLFPKPASESDRVTSATASADGRWVALRTYRTLYLFDAEEIASAQSLVPVAYDLTALGETQAESLVVTADGTIWTSSEAENRNALPTWTALRCPLPERAG